MRPNQHLLEMQAVVARIRQEIRRHLLLQMIKEAKRRVDLTVANKVATHPTKEVRQVSYPTRETKVLVDPIQVIKAAMDLAKGARLAISPTQISQGETKRTRVMQRPIKLILKVMRLLRTSKTLSRVMV